MKRVPSLWIAGVTAAVALLLSAAATGIAQNGEHQIASEQRPITNKPSAPVVRSDLMDGVHHQPL